jgi:hypothetical protein
MISMIEWVPAQRNSLEDPGAWRVLGANVDSAPWGVVEGATGIKMEGESGENPEFRFGNLKLVILPIFLLPGKHLHAEADEVRYFLATAAEAKELDIVLDKYMQVLNGISALVRQPN